MNSKAIPKKNEWFDSETELSENFPIKEYDITASPNDFNVKTMFDFIESGAVIIPGFQRNYVWDIKRASRLVESIILGLPIPQIFLYEESKNRFLVIDGQQRLMSIYYFIKQRFPRKEKRTEIRRIFGEEGCIPDEILENDEYFRKFNLILPEPLPSNKNRFHGLNYSTLGEHKLSFDLRTVRNIIVKQNLPEGDDSSVFEIFNRLNSGGVNLKPQEIRASLYHSDFYELLFKLNNDPRWRRLLGSEEPDLHMRDVEILLRGFALLIDGSNYRPSMVRFLNKFSQKSKSTTQPQINYLSNLFDAFLEQTKNLSDKSFFIKKTGRFSTLYFEAFFSAACTTAYLTRNLSVKELNMELVEKLVADRIFSEASQSETASKINVQIRLERARQIILGA